MLGVYVAFLKKSSAKNFTEGKVLAYIVRSNTVPRVILSGVPPRSHSALPRAFGALLQKFDYAQDDRRDGVEPRRGVRSTGSTRDSKILLTDPASRPPYGRVRLRKRHTVTFSPLRMTRTVIILRYKFE